MADQQQQNAYLTINDLCAAWSIKVAGAAYTQTGNATNDFCNILKNINAAIGGAAVTLTTNAVTDILILLKNINTKLAGAAVTETGNAANDIILYLNAINTKYSGAAVTLDNNAGRDIIELLYAISQAAVTPSLGSYTADFVSKYAIIDAGIIAALTTLENSMTAAGLIDYAHPTNNIVQHFYPCVGGVAAITKGNFLQPASTLKFYGGLTHSAAGIKGNGLNGYIDTELVAGYEFYSQDSHFSFYEQVRDPMTPTPWSYSTNLAFGLDPAPQSIFTNNLYQPATGLYFMLDDLSSYTYNPALRNIAYRSQVIGKGQYVSNFGAGVHETYEETNNKGTAYSAMGAFTTLNVVFLTGAMAGDVLRYSQSTINCMSLGKKIPNINTFWNIINTFNINLGR